MEHASINGHRRVRRMPTLIKRPPTAQAEADRKPIGFRVPPELKRRIEDAAKKSGRSQAQELELMIQQAFDRRDLIPQMLEAIYGPCDAAILLAFGEVMKLAGRTARFVATGSPGSDWVNVRAAHKQVKEGLMQIIDHLEPDGNSELEAPYRRLGQGVANTLLEEMASGLSRTPAQDRKRAETLHALAGPLAERLKPFDQLSGEAK
jgi:hypothetical protein